MSSKEKPSKKPLLRAGSSRHQVTIPNQPEVDSLAKIRASRYGRSSRYSRHSKFLVKTDEEQFQIRKALNAYVREGLQLQGRKTFFQRVFVLARNFEPPENDKPNGKESVYSAAKGARQRDFRVFFQKQMDRIFTMLEKRKCTQDILSGLFVCMDSYSYLMIEGDEDMLGELFYELAAIHDSLWTESKVFMVEDNIGETYFSIFHCRRSAVININEKFPPATPDDASQMSVQHLKLMEKIRQVAETFAAHIKQNDDMEMETTLPADPYNKLLPEVQRIELVLKSQKFYRNVKEYAKTYRLIPLHQDEESLFWPIPQNYMPLQIFERSDFDVNLTFNDKADDIENKPKQEEEDDVGDH
ncbi:uncharacterized protein LOC133334656 [Musca vetustissima]|uniref:uncharacterized protein LOC133334656 n=1 Tax=Musca vetustissima TaxID=27455 RepID=UPI002AB65B52|nr:uncharacterized protein LOC133334656 [Musca vetustissima]